MPENVGFGITVPLPIEKISAQGITEMRTLGSTTAGAIAAEAQARMTEDARIVQRIGTEEVTRSNQVASLQGRTSQLETGLSNEQSERTAADTSLNQRVDVLEDGSRPVLGINDLGDGTGMVDSVGTAVGIIDNNNGSIRIIS